MQTTESEIEVAAVGLTEEEMIEVVRKNEEQKGTIAQMKSNEPDKKDRPDPPKPQPAPAPKPIPQDDPLDPGHVDPPGKSGGG
jgi:hypothetical protein